MQTLQLGRHGPNISAMGLSFGYCPGVERQQGDRYRPVLAARVGR